MEDMEQFLLELNEWEKEEVKFGYLEEPVKEEANYLGASPHVENAHCHLTLVRVVGQM